MIKLHDGGVFIKGGREIAARCDISPEEARRATIAYRILKAHDVSGGESNQLHLKFDALASHDITYVGIIQSARVRGLEEFPVPYVLTNCHNSLCAVGGTINEDDHMFGLSAVKKYGGIFVPAHQAVIHSYMREQFAGCGRMILGSDSHTPTAGGLGMLAIGAGGLDVAVAMAGGAFYLNVPSLSAQPGRLECMYHTHEVGGSSPSAPPAKEEPLSLPFRRTSPRGLLINEGSGKLGYN